MTPVDAVRLNDESSDEKVVTVVAVQPKGWRDAWAVLRGRYVAKVVKCERFTLLGWDRQLKRIWYKPVREALNQQSPLVKLFERLGDSNV
jgi:hypothetical protein